MHRRNAAELAALATEVATVSGGQSRGEGLGFQVGGDEGGCMRTARQCQGWGMWSPWPSRRA